MLLPHKGTIAMFAAKRRVLLRCVGIPLTPTLNGAREKDRLLNMIFDVEVKRVTFWKNIL